MIVSEADSKTVGYFGFGSGLDFVFLVNPTFILFKWQRTRLNHCIVFSFDLFFQTNFTRPQSEKVGRNLLPGWNLMPTQSPHCHQGSPGFLGWGWGDRASWG